MPLSTRQMYYVALDNATEKGPRIISGKKGDVAAYSLTKKELKLIFAENGYSPRRKAWVNNVLDWELFGTIVSEQFDDYGSDKGYVIFTTLTKVAMDNLRYYADEHSIRYYPHPEPGAAI